MKQITARPFGRLRLLGWGLAAALLALPAVAMRFTGEVNWGAEDFIAAALLLGGLGLGIELVLRLPGRLAWRLGAVAALVLAFMLTWANLAVGLIGPEGSPLNLALFGLPLALLAGVWLSRPRRRG